MNNSISICWFRQDLRLADNPALTNASQHDNVLPIYIIDDINAGQHALGGACRYWLHHSLTALDQSLKGKLSIHQGNAKEVFDDILSRFDVQTVYWNRCYQPWQIARDTALKQHLQAKGVSVISSNGSLLWEPWQISKSDGTPYKVFTPFYRNGCLMAEPPRAPLPTPKHVTCLDDERGAFQVKNSQLLTKGQWHRKLEPHWDIGEEGAYTRLQHFLKEALPFYKDGRNIPAKPYISKLSPHLRFGELSPNQVWHAAQHMGDNEHIQMFCSELGWREFSYSLLYHHPNLPNQNLNTKFDAFPWTENMQLLTAWQKGLTGIPMVDAGMRELWQTGFMHNRVRMIASSFLVKNLRLHWHHGERWFWDTLVDADLASNSASWQWIAGCGADAAPYYRIFNPVIQGQKFDVSGDYVRQFIPEIAALPNKYLFCPWQAPAPVLKAAGITLGSTYPNPIVDLKQSRNAALAAFQQLSNKHTTQ
ncbi:MAG: deoxyribodipyrimidine photo-lyase [Gammaproteobacteria bacterium]|nr:deoxyribodipyrimidine photo-lyase [Gammaproteobacteria bacterium]